MWTQSKMHCFPPEETSQRRFLFAMSPSHHLTISPSHHHHLTISSSLHLPFSPSHYLIIISAFHSVQRYFLQTQEWVKIPDAWIDLCERKCVSQFWEPLFVSLATFISNFRGGWSQFTGVATFEPWTDIGSFPPGYRRFSAVLWGSWGPANSK